MTVSLLLEQSARKYGDRPALSLGSRMLLDYAGLASRVAGLAGGLRGRIGLRPGDRVGIFMRNHPAYIEAMWAIWWAGGCVVPMNSRLHQLEVAHIMTSSGARLLLTDQPHISTVGGLPDSVTTLERVIDVEGPDWQQLVQSDAIPRHQGEADDPVWLFYTSGTTGRPKGATLTNRNLLAMSWTYLADIDALTPADSQFHVAPLSHASGIYLLPHMAKAGNQIIPESGGFDAGEWADALGHWDHVSSFAAPTIVNRMLAEAEHRDVRVEALRSIVYGGAPMYVDDLKRAIACFGQHLCQIYGQGETPCTATVLPQSLHRPDTPDDILGSVGYFRTGVALRLKGVAEGATDEPGEVLLKSDVTMAGYWGDAAASAETLRDGWLHTGDIGVLDRRGFLTLKDRSKDVIISGGSNIYPREVEEVLLTHPDLIEVSVVGRPHADWGEEVIAFVAARPGAQISNEALDRLCLEHIARFKRPRDYVWLAELPKSAYGKILKSELRRHSAMAPQANNTQP